MALIISKDIEIAPSKTKKIGRNEPCWCGSGKKYKKCHLDQDEEHTYRREEKSETITYLIDWLMDQSWFKERVKHEMEAAFGTKKQVEEEEINNLIEALVFEADFKGKTPLQLFLEQASLQEEQKVYYLRWFKESIFSIFKVISIDLGQTIMVKDLFDQKTYTIHEKLATYSLEPGMIIFTRIIPHKTLWVFTGANLGAYPPEAAYSFERERELHRLSRLTQLGYVKYQYWQETTDYSQFGFNEIKETLKKEFKRLRVDIDIDEIDRQIAGHEGMDLTGLMQKISPLCRDQQEAERIGDLLMLFQNKHKRFTKEKDAPGPEEQRLVQQMMHEAEIKFMGTYQIEDTNKHIQTFSKQWFDIAQQELGGKTPRMIIMEERKKLGNPQKEIAYSLNVSAVREPKKEYRSQELYNKAIKILNAHKNYFDALQLLAEISKEVDFLPEPFRWYNNVGICLISLGEMDLAKRYFEKALVLNPDYPVPKTNLGNWKNPQTVRSMEESGKQLLFELVVDRFRLTDERMAAMEIVKDGQAFLQYIQSNKVKVTEKRQYITFKEVLSINNVLIKPDPVHALEYKEFPYREEWQMPKVNFLAVHFMTGGQIKIKNNHLILTKKGHEFLSLSSEEQWLFLFTNWLITVDWALLGERPDSTGQAFGPLQSLFQERSYQLINTLSQQSRKFNSQILVKGFYVPEKHREMISVYTLFLEKSFISFLEWFGIIKYLEKRSILEFITGSSNNDDLELTDFGRHFLSQIHTSMIKAIPQVIKNKL